MAAVLTVAVLLLAQAAQATRPDASQSIPTSEAAAPAKDAETRSTRAEACPTSSGDSTTIVICTQRPQGYRLSPDVMEAKREMKSGGRPVRPNGLPRPDCATVGPAPCVNAGINLLAAAATAVEMGQRLSKGQEIGSMFVTDPHPDEYHLYLMAKARREAEEAEKAAVAARTKANGSPADADTSPESPATPASH